MGPDPWSTWPTLEPGTSQRSRLVEIDPVSPDQHEEVFINSGPLNDVSSEWQVPFEPSDY